MKNALLTLLFLVLVPAYHALAQCSMCAATVDANSKEAGTAKAEGLNTGILWLMSFPYVLFAVVGFIWYRSAQRKKAARNPGIRVSKN